MTSTPVSESHVPVPDGDPPAARPWYAHLLWVPAGALLELGVSLVFASVFRWPRRFFLFPYVGCAAAFTIAFFRWNGIPMRRFVRHNWRKGLVGAAVTSAVVVWLVLIQAGSGRLSGWQLPVDLLWSGVAYGTADALMLTVIPVLATGRALSGFAWARSGAGRVWVRAAGFAASLVVAGVYHAGFPEFQGPEIAGAMVGNAFFALAYLLTGSPLAPVISHIAMHVAGILHGPGTVHQLPPHY
jgi:hypothetical protein